MSRSRQITALLLGLLAAVSGWWLWHQPDEDAEPALVGPPRSDYSLETFQLTALDANGKESFSVEGPRLSRHPFVGSLDIDSPRFRFPDQDGGQWSARSGHAFISAEGDRVRLYDDYVMRGPPREGTDPLVMNGPEINYFPKDNHAETDTEVTVVDGSSILRGRGMRAELNAHQVNLSHMQGHFETAPRATR